MATTREMISDWFDDGLKLGCSYMLIVVDTFNYEDYPVFVADEKDVLERVDHFDGRNLQKVMEVYDLRMSKELASQRTFNLP